ncbi:hypothetical protein D3C78_1882920 [compost metagenome]
MVVDPIGDFLAGCREPGLTRFQQGEQGGDGLFFGHVTPPFRVDEAAQNPPGAAHAVV